MYNRYFVLLFVLCSYVSSFSQTDHYTLTQKDTLITCTLTERSTIAGPFSDARSADFENLVAAVMNASPFPSYPYSIYRTKDSGYIRLGCHTYDESEYHTFVLYNLDSLSVFNLKTRTRFGTMALVAHEVGHHALNHFMRGLPKSILHQELQADYFAGWLLAKFNVPKSEVINGVAIIAVEQKTAPAYPTKQDRIAATLLGFEAGSLPPEKGPLALLENGEILNVTWLSKWSRLTTKSGTNEPVSEGIFTSTHFTLDKSGQLVYSVGAMNYVIACIMPSKDTRYRYMLFDNTFGYWWIAGDGTIKNADESKVMGHVDLDILH
jgi:hypothetical protein